jgi:hypothetical protein
MYYHLILVVKYRRQVFDDPVSERAKEIFDNTVAVEISGLELEPLKKESLKSATQSIMEDQDIQDLKDAAETAGKLLEAEKDLLNALF